MQCEIPPAKHIRKAFGILREFPLPDQILRTDEEYEQYFRWCAHVRQYNHVSKWRIDSITKIIELLKSKFDISLEMSDFNNKLSGNTIGITLDSTSTKDFKQIQSFFESSKIKCVFPPILEGGDIRLEMRI
jgi:hypothetical protein